MQQKMIFLAAIIAGIVGLYAAVVGLSHLFGRAGESPSSAQASAIEWWHVYDTPAQIQPLLDQFTAETGIRVRYRSFTDLAQYRRELLTELAAGRGPDIASLHYEWLPEYQRILAASPITPAQVQRDFVDAVAEGVTLPEIAGEKVEQKVYGLPLSIDTLALYFNRDFFKTVLGKASGQPESSWQGLAAESARLTLRDESTASQPVELSGFAAGRADNLARGVDLFLSLYLQAGGQQLRPGTVPQLAAERAGNRNPAETALAYLAGFSADPAAPTFSWPADSAPTPDKEIDPFARKKLAMLAGFRFTGASIETTITALERTAAANLIARADVGTAPLPQLSANQATLASYFALTVPRASQHQPEAWNLIQWLTQPSQAQAYVNATNSYSPRREILAAAQSSGRGDLWVSQAVFARAASMPSIETRDQLAAMIDSVADGQVTIQQAIANFDQAMRDAAATR